MRALGAGVLGSALLAVVALAEPVAIVGGTVHPISSAAIENGVVIMDGESISAIGTAGRVVIPPGAERIDASGLHVWPGLTNALTYLGIYDIGSVRGTQDFDESGAMNPNARVEVAINVSSDHFGVARSNGTLLAAVLPRGAMVPGTAATIVLDGWTWEEMVRKAPLALVIQWPSMRPPPAGADDDASRRPPWEERIARLDEMIDEARAYDAALTEGMPRAGDVRWDSLRPVVRGETPVWIHAAGLSEIRAALDWTDRHGLSMVLVDGTSGHGGDAWRATDELRARGIPVVLRTNRLPARRYELYDTPFTEPARLHEAGVAIAFGSWSSSSARDLPQEAARAIAFGLPRAAAERALTLGGAEILGVAERYGSLEPGKSATMILVEGDLLETRMHVRRAWIDGRELDLNDRHKQLYQKWSARPMPTARSEAK